MFSEFIEEKGAKPLSILLGVTYATVRKWKEREVIPEPYWARLMEVYPGLTRMRLLDMEVASRPCRKVA